MATGGVLMGIGAVDYVRVPIEKCRPHPHTHAHERRSTHTLGTLLMVCGGGEGPRVQNDQPTSQKVSFPSSSKAPKALTFSRVTDRHCKQQWEEQQRSFVCCVGRGRSPCPRHCSSAREKAEKRAPWKGKSWLGSPPVSTTRDSSSAGRFISGTVSRLSEARPCVLRRTGDRSPFPRGAHNGARAHGVGC